MGEAYKGTLQNKIKELGGGEKLRVFINSNGVHPHYKQHLVETFEEVGASFVDEREAANFVFDGDQKPIYGQGQVAAFFQDHQVVFAGGLQ